MMVLLVSLVLASIRSKYFSTPNNARIQKQHTHSAGHGKILLYHPEKNPLEKPDCSSTKTKEKGLAAFGDFQVPPLSPLRHIKYRVRIQLLVLSPSQPSSEWLGYGVRIEIVIKGGAGIVFVVISLSNADDYEIYYARLKSIPVTLARAGRFFHPTHVISILAERLFSSCRP
jgi:hypothetical protein